jgi:hypothetical protein
MVSRLPLNSGGRGASVVKVDQAMARERARDPVSRHLRLRLRRPHHRLHPRRVAVMAGSMAAMATKAAKAATAAKAAKVTTAAKAHGASQAGHRIRAAAVQLRAMAPGTNRRNLEISTPRAPLRLRARRLRQAALLLVRAIRRRRRPRNRAPRPNRRQARPLRRRRQAQRLPQRQAQHHPRRALRALRQRPPRHSRLIVVSRPRPRHATREQRLGSPAATRARPGPASRQGIRSRSRVQAVQVPWQKAGAKPPSGTWVRRRRAHRSRVDFLLS